MVRYRPSRPPDTALRGRLRDSIRATWRTKPRDFNRCWMKIQWQVSRKIVDDYDRIGWAGLSPASACSIKSASLWVWMWARMRIACRRAMLKRPQKSTAALGVLTTGRTRNAAGNRLLKSCSISACSITAAPLTGAVRTPASRTSLSYA